MDAALTLPLYVWAAIGTGLTTAVVWLAKTYRDSMKSAMAEVVQLAREITKAMTENTEVIRTHAALLRAIASELEDRNK